LLYGLDSLLTGTPDIAQVNMKTQNLRRVELHTGPVPKAMPPSPISMTSVAKSRSFAQFKLEGGSRGVPLPPESQIVLRESWRMEPRPQQVQLPSGEVIEGFGDLELGGAGMTSLVAATNSGGSFPFQVRGQSRPSSKGPNFRTLVLDVPVPPAGQISLPEDLDVDAACDPLAHGRLLSNKEVVALHTRGPEANKCSICLADMEPSSGNWTNAVSSVAMPRFSNAVPSHEAEDVEMLDATSAVSQVIEMQCGHAYHCECISQWFEQKRRCPQCQRDFGKVVGDQPRTGTFSWQLAPFPLPGHPNAKETIVIEFDFPPGTTDQGVQFEGRKPRGYLPGNAQGIVLLELFKVAFRRCVMFGLGNSMTFGTLRPTFNIHIKTSTSRGTVGHGYPDPSYFQRSLEELRANGVTIADLPV